MNYNSLKEHTLTRACVCVRADSHKNGVVQAKTRVAISQSSGDAAPMSVKASAEREGVEESLSFSASDWKIVSILSGRNGLFHWKDDEFEIWNSGI